MSALRWTGSTIRAIGIATGISIAGIAVGVLVAAVAGMASGSGSGSRSSDLAALGTTGGCLPGLPCPDETLGASGPADTPAAPAGQPQVPAASDAGPNPLTDLPTVGGQPDAGVAVPRLPLSEPDTSPDAEEPPPAQVEPPPPAASGPLGEVTYSPPPLKAVGLPLAGLDGKFVVTNTSGESLGGWTARFTFNGGQKVLSGGQLGAGASVQISAGVSLTLGEVGITNCTFNGRPCG